MTRKNTYLFLVIAIASLTLVSVDHYTIKILSAVRAYINGESEYSKGQKDALLYLYSYIETEDPAYFQSFRKSIEVPVGDNSARKALLNKSDDATTFHYFLKARNHPDDIPQLIWLFKTFQSSYMKTPIRLWTEAEPLITQLGNIGDSVRLKIEGKTLTKDEKLLVVKKISLLSAELYKKESEFSQVLGTIARKINTYLLLANIFCIISIIGSITIYVMSMLQRMHKSNITLETKNNEIIETNKELDTLVYSISHDLRSPITSIKGLIELLREEDDISLHKEYMELIESTINKQDVFILEIIDIFQNKRLNLCSRPFSIRKIIAEIVASNRFSQNVQNLDITEQIEADIVHTDELRVKMILNNLISNAIKYSDERKQRRTISIKAICQCNDVVIEIADNGIGIDKAYINNIYDMFFVTANNNKGSGLGLYILKQNVEKLKGRVEVESELGVGTKFTVFIPNSFHAVNVA